MGSVGIDARNQNGALAPIRAINRSTAAGDQPAVEDVQRARAAAAEVADIESACGQPTGRIAIAVRARDRRRTGAAHPLSERAGRGRDHAAAFDDNHSLYTSADGQSAIVRSEEHTSE